MSTIAQDLTYSRDGAQLHAAALDRVTVQDLIAALSDQPAYHAGTRLFGVGAIRPFVQREGPVGMLAASILGDACHPVRAILFDKTPHTNWALGWHQDRVIAVETRVDVEGFGPWTRKHGALHVAPPFSVLAQMATIRVHLDDVPTTNAPLLIAPGSHRLGRIAEADVQTTVRRCGVSTCLAMAGDAWLYATPILHASEAASVPCRRRVLQVDYAAADLPGGLNWLGV